MKIFSQEIERKTGNCKFADNKSPYVASVSYTHLAREKREAEHTAREAELKKKEKKVDELQEQRVQEPVSYTHLDVYKRQLT